MSCKSVIKLRGCQESALGECLASVPKTCEKRLLHLGSWLLPVSRKLFTTIKKQISRTTYRPFVAPQNHSQNVTPYQFHLFNSSEGGVLLILSYSINYLGGRGGGPFSLIYQVDPLGKSIPNPSCKQKLQFCSSRARFRDIFLVRCFLI